MFMGLLLGFLVRVLYKFICPARPVYRQCTAFTPVLPARDNPTHSHLCISNDKGQSYYLMPYYQTHSPLSFKDALVYASTFLKTNGELIIWRKVDFGYNKINLTPYYI